MKIIVEWKFGIAHAKVSDRPEVRGQGKTSDEAVGNLVTSHQDKLPLVVEVQNIS